MKRAYLSILAVGALATAGTSQAVLLDSYTVSIGGGPANFPGASTTVIVEINPVGGIHAPNVVPVEGGSVIFTPDMGPHGALIFAALTDGSVAENTLEFTFFTFGRDLPAVVDFAGQGLSYFQLTFDVLNFDGNGYVDADVTISFHSGPVPGESVPDGGTTALMLGLGVAGLAWCKRRH